MWGVRRGQASGSFLKKTTEKLLFYLGCSRVTSTAAAS
jgi:hypothetical protein